MQSSDPIDHLIFDPIYIEKPWGGSHLTGKPGIGEAFLVSDLNNNSTSSNGLTITDLQRTYHEEYLGAKINQRFNGLLPVYLKALDAADNLSIQVHPNDIQARELEGEALGKTEAWYITSCEKGAGIYVGLKNGTTKKQLEDALTQGADITKLLNFVPVQPGDFFFIPAGLVHAVGKGVQLLEPQQNSNRTYRVWDWNRVDDSGLPRELHVERSLQVINFDASFNDKYAQKIAANNRLSFESDYFDVDVFSIGQASDLGSASHSLQVNGNYKIITIAEGAVEIIIDGKESVHLEAGRGCIVPAFINEVTIASDKISKVMIVSPKG